MLPAPVTATPTRHTRPNPLAGLPGAVVPGTSSPESPVRTKQTTSLGCKLRWLELAQETNKVAKACQISHYSPGSSTTAGHYQTYGAERATERLPERRGYFSTG